MSRSFFLLSCVLFRIFLFLFRPFNCRMLYFYAKFISLGRSSGQSLCIKTALVIAVSCSKMGK